MISFETFIKLCKKLSGKIRPYETVFYVDEDRYLVYTNGFCIIRIITRHQFISGVYDFNGQPSQVKYPKYTNIVEEIIKKEEVLSSNQLLNIANYIVPNKKCKESICLDLHGKIGITGLPLKYLNISNDLGFDTIKLNNDLCYVFNKDNEQQFMIFTIIKEETT